MCHAVGLAEPGLFQLDSLRKLVEQPTASSEQDTITTLPMSPPLFLPMRPADAHELIAECRLPRDRSTVRAKLAPRVQEVRSDRYGVSPEGCDHVNANSGGRMTTTVAAHRAKTGR